MRSGILSSLAAERDRREKLHPARTRVTTITAVATLAPLLLYVLAFLPLTIPCLARAEGAGISWSETALEMTVFPGTAHLAAVQFTSDREVLNASILVTPEIAPLLSVQWLGDESITPGVPNDVIIAVAVPASVSWGTYEGTVHVRSGRRTVPHTLKVGIHVVPATSTHIPSEIASASDDRLIRNANGQLLVQDELVVLVDPSAPDPEMAIRDAAVSTGGVIIGAAPDLLAYQLRYDIASSEELKSIQELLETHSGISDVALAYLAERPALIGAPDDTEYGTDPWDENQPEGFNWNLEYIKALSAWSLDPPNTTGDPNVRMAIVDTVFDPTHEDLENNVLPGTESSLLSKVRCLWPGNDENCKHGTAVAGVACAEGNNGRGIAGVAWQCALSLHEIFSLLKYRPDDPSILVNPMVTAKKMLEAARNDARIVNVSLGHITLPECRGAGTPEPDGTVLDTVNEVNKILGAAIRRAEREGKDVLWIFGAGNDGVDAKYQSPASLADNFDNVITVAGIASSLDPDSAPLWGCSNHGSVVKVAAPGVIITTTVPNGYETLRAGTSFAAPHVAGVAALVLSARDDSESMTAADVKQCIINAAKVHGAEVRGHSFKVINAAEAVRCDSSINAWEDVVWGKGGDVVTARFDGSGQRPVIQDPDAVLVFPTVSPDGRRIAYLRQPTAGGSQVCVLDTASVSCADTPGFTYGPSWGAASRVVYYARNQGDGEIWRVDFGRPNPTAERLLDPAVYRTFGVSVSRDGQKLVMVHDPRNWTYDNFLSVYRFSDGSSTTILPSDGLRDFFPDYSPTRDEIVWGRGTEPNCCLEPLDIWIINDDGSNARNLTSDAIGSQEYPRFSPDGDHVFFIERTGRLLWVMGRDGSNPTPLLDMGTDSQGERFFDIATPYP